MGDIVKAKEKFGVIRETDFEVGMSKNHKQHVTSNIADCLCVKSRSYVIQIHKTRNIHVEQTLSSIATETQKL